MKINCIYILFIVLLMFSNCQKDYDLQKTVFFSDPDFPDLPKYTEWGYNTFGAYYDRQVFTSSDNIIPLKIIVKDSITSFKFNGRINNSYIEMSMTFTMDNFLPTYYSDLIQLDQKSIDLKDPQYGVNIKIDGVDQVLTVLNGHLDFKKAQILIVDKKAEEVILSGEFEFQVVIGSEPFTISRGRFDIGVSYDNFFNFQKI